ncbi:nitroreductase family protein [Chloroflexota bacterium]
MPIGVCKIALKRRSMRPFKNKAVPHEVLEKCINAAGRFLADMDTQLGEQMVLAKYRR